MEDPLIRRADEEEAAMVSPTTERSVIYVDIVPVAGEAVMPSLGPPRTSTFANLIADLSKKTLGLPRSHSAPSVFTEARDSFSDLLPRSTPLLFRQVFIGAVFYFLLMIPIFLLTGSFKNPNATFGPVDAMYFTVVTFCAIGYGDIVPNTTFTKLFTCLFILAGVGFIYILLNSLVTHICDRQESLLLGTVDENMLNNLMQTYMIDKVKGRMRIRLKVSLALAVVAGSLTIGTIGVHYLEEMSWVDSFYLAVTSVTTVGYGDLAFKTLHGRCFAILWLLISTVAVTRAFLYLAEFRIDKRNRRIAKYILQKKITLRDLVAADLDNDGSISKSEFVIFKLKEMGKISENEILEICNQFDSLDSTSCGKLTIADVMESE